MNEEKNIQRMGQMLVNYVRTKYKCKNEEIHTHLWNMSDKEFQQFLKDAPKGHISKFFSDSTKKAKEKK